MAKKILIIDDEVGDRELILEALGNSGIECEIKIADRGEEGVRQAKEYRPDIVLVDTIMPDLNGFQTCKKLKEIQGLEAKVIVMTGCVDAVDATTARAMGADDYCVKTSDSAPIIDALRKII